MHQFIWLIPLGFLIGAYGTLIGAGGGFILMPFLILWCPTESREVLASVSLAVVFGNALSGSVAYARSQRIDYRSGMLFSLATVPGAVLGAFATGWLSMSLFDVIFGILLIAVSATLFWGFGPKKNSHKRQGLKQGASLHRQIIEKDGTAHAYSFNPWIGVSLSFFVGFISSLLGIGGGIIHVPALVYLLNFPVHIATATSHFMLAIMALAGTLVHVATGTFAHGCQRAIFLAIGVLVGAQFGARWSNKLRGRWIIRGLAVALAFVGIRILATAL